MEWAAEKGAARAHSRAQESAQATEQGLALVSGLSWVPPRVEVLEAAWAIALVQKKVMAREWATEVETASRLESDWGAMWDLMWAWVSVVK